MRREVPVLFCEPERTDRPHDRELAVIDDDGERGSGRQPDGEGSHRAGERARGRAVPADNHQGHQTEPPPAYALPALWLRGEREVGGALRAEAVGPSLVSAGVHGPPHGHLLTGPYAVGGDDRRDVCDACRLLARAVLRRVLRRADRRDDATGACGGACLR